MFSLSFLLCRRRCHAILVSFVIWFRLLHLFNFATQNEKRKANVRHFYRLVDLVTFVVVALVTNGLQRQRVIFNCGALKAESHRVSTFKLETQTFAERLIRALDVHRRKGESEHQGNGTINFPFSLLTNEIKHFWQPLTLHWNRTMFAYRSHFTPFFAIRIDAMKLLFPISFALHSTLHIFPYFKRMKREARKEKRKSYACYSHLFLRFTFFTSSSSSSFPSFVLLLFQLFASWNNLRVPVDLSTDLYDTYI